MTREARQTQKRLEGEILKLLEGEEGSLYAGPEGCAFCKKHLRGFYCGDCPLVQGSTEECCYCNEFQSIDADMILVQPDAIPGALAIYMWLEEL